MAAPTEIVLKAPAALEKWVQAPVANRDFPNFQSLDDTRWLISTNSTSSAVSNSPGRKGSAGGFVWALPHALRHFKIEWSWKVIEFPKQAAAGFFSFLKGRPDDAAIRVGLVFDSGEKNFPETAATLALRKSAENSGTVNGLAQATMVSSVVFFNSSNLKDQKADRFSENCKRTSLSHYITYCPVLSADAESKSNTADMKPVAIDSHSPDIKKIPNFSGSLIALWIFADSDDSMSSSKAILKLVAVAKLEKAYFISLFESFFLPALV